MTRGEQLAAALSTELLKFRSALVPRIASVALVGGIVALCASSVLAAGQPGSVMAMKVAAIVPGHGWTALLGVGAQITAVGGLIGFGVVLAWLFGREFVDGAIGGLFALPVPRATVAAAKLAIYAAWAAASSAAIMVAVGITGFALGFGVPSVDELRMAAKLLLIASSTAALAAPCALIATLARGYLAPIGMLIGLVVLAQIAAMTGIGGWFPWAAPGLWAGSNGGDAARSVNTAQLLLVIPVTGLFIVLCLRSWRHLEL